MSGTPPRRELVVVLVGCVVGAALVLLAAGREWVELVTVRPEPLPPVREGRSGGQLAPWLPAVGWVGLAGAGALLATRGRGRLLVGGLLIAAGAGAIAGVVRAVLEPGTGPLWPVLAAVGGVMVFGAGLAVLRRGQRWPAMGARYDRSTRRRANPPSDPRDQRPEQVWEALDRGEDPTA